MKTIQQILIGTSAAIGASLLVTAPAFAASLTNIQFNTTDYKVYTRDGSAADAASVLTDIDAVSNVELGFSTENQMANVGFSANLGGHAVSVETVTAADWAVFGNQWLADFQAAYPSLFAANIMGINLGQAIAATVMSGPDRIGDPNIGSFAKDDESGVFTLHMVGHYDVLNAPWLKTSQYAAAIPFVKSILGGEALQMSEVAKVTIDGNVHYAYSFAASETGWLAPDRAANDMSSGSGLYAWTLQGAPTPPTESVPEPSLMLGLAAIGGLFVAAKRKA